MQVVHNKWNLQECTSAALILVPTITTAFKIIVIPYVNNFIAYFFLIHDLSYQQQLIDFTVV